MIEAGFFYAWDQLVESAAFLAIIILAFCVMVSAVKLADAPRRLGLIVGVAILLIMLPAIIISLWNSMSIVQQLGIVVIVVATLVLLRSACQKSKGKITSRS